MLQPLYRPVNIFNIISQGNVHACIFIPKQLYFRVVPCPELSDDWPFFNNSYSCIFFPIKILANLNNIVIFLPKLLESAFFYFSKFFFHFSTTFGFTLMSIISSLFLGIDSISKSTVSTRLQSNLFLLSNFLSSHIKSLASTSFLS